MNKLLLAVLIVTLTNCIFEGDSAVISLYTDTHDQVKQGIWLMDYYASWCGHCQQMAPEYQKVAQSLKGIVKVAAIDAGSQRINNLNPGIRGFPTIRFLYNNQVVAYEGERTARDMISFVFEQLEKIVKSRNDPNYKKPEKKPQPVQQKKPVEQKKPAEEKKPEPASEQQL